ncbi:type I-E CRISPR-associated protein Cse1/CasA [Methylocystis sp. WRRC1]|uniref:type I-E CRISPR-associated protein Cse1/CasA n=1 Tax=Methylocystis sp. WRRC1 TaxID=1732014 RepID=UPI001D13687A|nr:type I-E CRISPR-associated protein Cse1/CasA [Methylocystis sp. WRRC1]MCC3246303.1 type I-E CRISPR-associated protein Cse1/CasA [Methylocystis sp. WRRC1]
MTFSLLATPWLPVRRRSGAKSVIRPAEIASNFADDPVVAFAWGRPDFDAAAREFMIGLLATAFAPADGKTFLAWWRDPPEAAQLDEAFAPFVAAFVLDGEGARFGQDMDALADADETPISGLLIEAPGANTIKENKDLFQKRGQVQGLSRAAAAMALFTLQTFAPSGGAGHRVSLRGGGPLTTLVAPSYGTTELWRLLWLNTPQVDSAYPPAHDSKERIFPWLAPTMTSEGKPPRTVSPHSSHILQAFWGMPRRIRLSFGPNTSRAQCSITGEIDDCIVATYRTRPYGVSYDASFEHNLSPYYRPKAKGDWLPVHPQPGGVLYKDWPSVAGEASEEERPARIVAIAARRVRSLGRVAEARLLAAGFDMDNMKARGFVETEMPIFLLPEEAIEEFHHSARGIVGAADLAASATGIAVRIALAGERADGKATPFSALREAFFQETQDDFFALLREFAHRFASFSGDPTPMQHEIGDRWLKILKARSLAMFEEAVGFDVLPLKIMERAVPARRDLIGAFSGFGGMGRKIFAALDLEPPQPKKKAGKAA